MVHMSTLRLCWPARAVERHHLFALPLHEFVLVIIEKAPEGIERQILKSFERNCLRPFEETPRVEDFEFAEMRHAIPFG